MNHPQKRRVAATFQHVDKLLRSAAEAVLGQGGGSPFSGLLPDVTPDQQQRVLEGVRLARARMASALAELDIPTSSPPVSASRSAYTDLMFAEVDLEDIAPKRFTGYGPLSREDTRALEEVVGGLLAILGPVRAALAPEDEGNLR
ncbi:MAG: hypothetical protein KGI56_07710 [Acidobacteriota bacterium]|nr:hypothetical protein [Acidobacteriota bacterium]